MLGIFAPVGGENPIAVYLALLAGAKIDAHCAIDIVILHDGAARTPNQQPKSTIPLQNQFPNLRRRTLIDNTAPNGPRAYDLSFHSFGLDIDTYDYDAFGNLINSTGSTPNNYLFAGEQYDSALALYYNRARYLNTATGRFWSMDTEDGDDEEPASLHKYTYAEDNPVDNTDRSGNEIDEIAVAAAISVTLDAMPSVAQAGAAVTRQARFAALLRSYPSHADHSSDPKQPGNIWALIGGHVQMNAYNIRCSQQHVRDSDELCSQS